MTADGYTAGLIDGWLAALSAAGKCAAHNPDRSTTRDTEIALCIREFHHTGKHDDGWLLWGDREATADTNSRAAAADRRRLLGQAPSR